MQQLAFSSVVCGRQALPLRGDVWVVDRLRTGAVRYRRNARARYLPCCAVDNALRALRDRRSSQQDRTKRTNNPSNHVVYLVGTGPGDPGLLTIRAVELMRRADVVLYDRLVSPEILDYVNDGATMVYVGKEKGFHTRSQSEIHELLLHFAFSRPGSVVIRLKGGDPFVFGRGGEETEYLERHGVVVRVIPGITAAAGIGAELGIPLTHRGIAQSVTFLTGHVRDSGDVDNDNKNNIDNNELQSVLAAANGNTIVVYMGLSAIRPLTRRLLANSKLRRNTPAAAVERGTTPQQRVVWSTLDALADDVEKDALKSPTLIIIGDVVALAPAYKALFENNDTFDTVDAVISNADASDLDTKLSPESQLSFSQEIV